MDEYKRHSRFSVARNNGIRKEKKRKTVQFHKDSDNHSLTRAENPHQVLSYSSLTIGILIPWVISSSLKTEVRCHQCKYSPYSWQKRRHTFQPVSEYYVRCCVITLINVHRLNVYVCVCVWHKFPSTNE